jgi:hypothetical protein
MDEDPEWEEASQEVIHIAEGLIRKHHRHIEMLHANICFVFRKDAQKNKGHTVLGHCEKISEKMRVFQDYHFLIWLSKADWERMTSEQREALIDHELCHIRLSGGGLTVVGHDFEEFYEIIQRHGFWDQRLKRIDRELVEHQMSLGLKLDEAFSRVGTLNKEQLAQMETAKTS